MAKLDGWDGWDGWDASNSKPGLSNQLVSDALRSSREQVLSAIGAGAPDWSKTAASIVASTFARDWGTASTDGLPAPGSSAWMSRMSTWAHRQVYQAELNKNLMFEEDKAKHAIKLSYRDASNTKHPIAGTTRPTKEIFVNQTKLVINLVGQRKERSAEIHTQVITYMPFWSSICHLEPSTTPKTYEVIIAAIQFASTVIQYMKYFLACPRPSQFSPRVQPMITPPEFFAFPSGHATQAFMIARLLQVLMKEEPGKSLDKSLQKQAEMIANNRVIAGVHFPVDGMAGRAIGESLAEYFVHRCSGGGWIYRAFDGTKATNLDANLQLRESIDSADGNGLQPYYLGNDQRSKKGTVANIDAGIPDSPLGWLWQKASNEWKL